MSRPPISFRLWLRRIVPSTISSGPVDRPLALMEVGPRSRIAGVLPGWPLVLAIRMPATLPCSAVTGLSAGTGRSAAVTRPIANGTFERSVPSIEPVTTISLRRLMSFLSEKLCDCAPPVSFIATMPGW